MRRIVLLSSAVAFTLAVGIVASGANEDSAGICRTQGESHDATVVGTPTNDTITGTEQSDVINALDGDDVIDVRGGGVDYVCGGDGNDRIYIDGGVDQVTAGDGDDYVETADAGADTGATG